MRLVSSPVNGACTGLHQTPEALPLGNFLLKSSETSKAARYLLIQCIRSPKDGRRFPSLSTLGKRNLACSPVGDKATTFGVKE